MKKTGTFFLRSGLLTPKQRNGGKLSSMTLYVATLYVLTVNLETESFCEFPITTAPTFPALTATGLSIAAGRTL